MTTAPADDTATTEEAPEPRPGLTTTQRVLIALVVALVVIIAAIGFAGSYAAVSHLAAAKGFGRFAKVFPLGLDSGIGAFLALDLLLTWLRIPFPLLRYGAWTLTVATVAFNADAAWPDPIGVGMHAVIPVLFVIAVEAARHAVGRIADITADKHVELPPIKRWIVAPYPTFRLWRRQILWGIRKYDDAVSCERQIRVYRTRLRTEHGRRWRRTARAEQLLVLNLATRSGLTIAQALALPEQEAADLENAERERQSLRDAERAERERQEREERDAAERAHLARRLEEEDAERQRTLAEARTRAELAEIERQQQEAQAESDRRHAAEQIALAAQKAAAEKEAADAAAVRLRAEQERRREAERIAEAKERAKAIERQAAEVRAALANPRTGTANREPGTANPTGTSTRTVRRELEPRTANSGSANPANLGDRAANKQNQVATVVNLIDELGYDATTLPVVMDRTGMTKTTAYHRLTAAREIWNQREAS